MASPLETLRTLHELRAAATPGPWSVRHRCAPYTVDDDEVLGMGLDIHGPPEALNDGMLAKAADAKFIVAAANTDFAALLAEAQKLEAESEKLREQNAKLIKLAGEAFCEGWFRGIKRGEVGPHYTMEWQRSESKVKRDQLKASQ